MLWFSYQLQIFSVWVTELEPMPSFKMLLILERSWVQCIGRVEYYFMNMSTITFKSLSICKLSIPVGLLLENCVQQVMLCASQCTRQFEACSQTQAEQTAAVPDSWNGRPCGWPGLSMQCWLYTECLCPYLGLEELNTDIRVVKASPPPPAQPE